MAFSSPAALAHLLFALALLLSAAHAGGWLMRKLRQPSVIGEIAGGVALGPTLLGVLAPAWQRGVFAADASTAAVLGALYQLGLLLLMFCSGLEVRSTFREGEGRTSLFITAAGVALPFGAALAAQGLFHPAQHMGAAQSEPALALVLAIGVAVTSIPVISRILLDLGVIDTPFARIVLAAAVIEDVALYVLLAIALSLVHDDPGAAYGLPALLGVRGAGAGSLAYHVAASSIFLAASLLAGPRGYRRVRPLRLFRETNPIANLLLLLFAITGLALALGIAPFLGAFAAGLCANRAGEDPSGARHSIRSFSFAFLIPVYFALVGLRLDLLRDFQPLFFLGFLAFACAVKLASVYAGARVAGEGRRGAWNLAMAMNARGGPGIVLASVALDARIIDGALYTTLVVLSVVTSSIAGWWLERALRAGQPLR